MELRRVLDCSSLVDSNDCIPGDTDLNGVFNQRDIVQVLQAGKYLTGQPAGWAEGDWSGDGVFDRLDIVAALQGAAYRTDAIGSANGPGGERNEGQTDPNDPIPALPDPDYKLPDLPLTVDTYADCGELHADFQERLKLYRERLHQFDLFRMGAYANAVDWDVADSPLSGESTFSNVQERGVDEADYVKIGLHHVFVARQDAIEVVDRQSLEQLGRIAFSTDQTEQPTGDFALPTYYDGYPQRTMYTDQDRLILVEAFQNEAKVRVFSGSQGAVPGMIAEKTFTGRYIDSRFVQGRLIMVLTDGPQVVNYHPLNDQWEPTPIEGEPIQFSQVPCNRIAKPPIEDADLSLTKVVSYNTRDKDEKPAMTATLGGGDQIYMTESNLYITKYVLANYWSVNRVDVDNWNDTLIVTKVKFFQDTPDVYVTAIGAVRGEVKDQWAFREYGQHEDALSIATTTYAQWSTSHAKTNHLWVLKQNGKQLETVAAINDFGRTEDIRSVRYVGDLAYVVTFKKTDPLFAFDMSDPMQPRQLGELKIPGFSTYMHPVGPDQLFGVGFDAFDQGSFALYQGIQVSLFDVQDPRQMRRTDNIVIGGRGSNSEVTANHHAFYFDSSRMTVGIPIVELQTGHQDSWNYENAVAFTGAILFGIDGDQLVERHRLSHEEWIPETCQGQDGGRWWQDEVRSQDIDRLFQVDGRLLTISRWGIKSHDLDNPTTVTQQTRFESSKHGSCDP